MLQAAAAWHQAMGLVSWREERQSCSSGWQVLLLCHTTCQQLFLQCFLFGVFGFFFPVKFALSALPQRVLCSKTPARVSTGNVSLTSSAGKLGLLCPQSIVPAPLLLPVCHPSSGTTAQSFPVHPTAPRAASPPPRAPGTAASTGCPPFSRCSPVPSSQHTLAVTSRAFFPGNGDSR